jgi:hypothetical protein
MVTTQRTASSSSGSVGGSVGGGSVGSRRVRPVRTAMGSVVGLDDDGEGDVGDGGDGDGDGRGGDVGDDEDITIADEREITFDGDGNGFGDGDDDGDNVSQFSKEGKSLNAARSLNTNTIINTTNANTNANNKDLVTYLNVRKYVTRNVIDAKNGQITQVCDGRVMCFAM